MLVDGEARRLSKSDAGFDGHRVLVSGSTGTLGRLLCIELARLGATVICAGRDRVNLRSLLKELPNGPHELLVSPMASSESLSDVVHAHSRDHGGFDAVALLTGKIYVLPSHFYSQDELESLWSANYSVPISYASAFLSSPRTTNADRIIVAASSVSAVRPQPGLAVYGASKAAMESHLFTMGKEFAGRGVRVNIVRGGLVDSPMALEIQKKVGQENFDQHAARYPLGIGSALSLVNPLIFALSPAASWMAGSIITVDGGYSS